MTHNSSRLARLFSLLALAVLAPGAKAQFAERPHLPGSGEAAVDASGRSIKNPRIRAIHTDDPNLKGGTAYLLSRDPFLAYQLGRNLNFREFRDRDGVFSGQVSQLAGPMPDGTTAKITANNHTSCSGCHNLPTGNPGGGANFSKDSGFGRQTPHFYGSGIMEMLAIQIRAELLAQLDKNKDGWVSYREARKAPATIGSRPEAGASELSFGSPRLDGGKTGSPSFNNIIRVWYVDEKGRHVPGATSVDLVETYGYNFEVVVWGWGQGKGNSALNPTNRAFVWDPLNAHSGLEACDPSTTSDPDGDGVSEPTLSGAIQFPATHKAPDKGIKKDALGRSLDDPDGDGYIEEITEGDLDLGEWYLLNAPRPAFKGTPKEYRRGVAIMDAMGCTTCHTESWDIRAKDETFAGDRRFIDLDVDYNERTGQLEGELVRLYDKVGQDYVRRFDSYAVEGLFSDLRHHDMGEDMAELGFDGNVNTIWRTPPLWGVGSGFPWGHDGMSLTLEDVILRHGGEGSASRIAYLSATQAERDQLIDFLRDLVLYDIWTLPTDIDGDGKISKEFYVAGENTGTEVFNAEWLFRAPLQIQGAFVNSKGDTIISQAGVNISKAYGLGLPLRRDSDADGWPDVIDPCPQTPGYKDGCN